MMRNVLMLGILALMWGWIVFGAIGIYALVTATWAKRKMPRAVLGVCAIVLAVCWAKPVDKITTGSCYQALQTQTGDMQVEAWEKGGGTQFLVVRRDGSIGSTFFTTPKRLRIFWIREGETMGIILGDRHWIGDAKAILQRESLGGLGYRECGTPEEEKVFEAAERASREP